MAVEVRTNLKGLEKQIRELSDREMKKNMGKIGIKTLEINETAITRGRNADGTRFAPYTPAYATRKGSSRVDLILTGNMLADYGILRATRDKVIVGFRNDINKKKARGNSKKRKFVGLNERGQKELVRYAEKELIT
jgi:hypothetical protein